MFLVFSHTLQVKFTQSNTSFFQTASFKPSYEHPRPTTWDILLHIPSNSTATLSFLYEARMLRLHEYNMEPHRGIVIQSAVGYVCEYEVTNTTFPSSSSLSLKTLFTKQCSALFHNKPPQDNHPGRFGSTYYRLYTSPLLLPLPLPDFSMPFNAIMIVSGLLAVCLVAVVHIGPDDNGGEADGHNAQEDRKAKECIGAKMGEGEKEYMEAKVTE